MRPDQQKATLVTYTTKKPNAAKLTFRESRGSAVRRTRTLPQQAFEELLRESFEQSLAAAAPASAALNAANMRRVTEAAFGYLEPLQGAQHCRTSDRHALEPLVVTAMQEELYCFLLDWLQRSASSGSDTAGARTPETTAMVMSWAIFGAGLE